MFTSNREPSIIVGTITAVVTAAIALLVAFGVELSTEQQVAVLGVVAAVAPLVAALITRTKVHANASVAAVSVHGTTLAGPASSLPDGTPVDVYPTGKTGGLNDGH